MYSAPCPDTSDNEEQTIILTSELEVQLHKELHKITHILKLHIIYVRIKIIYHLFLYSQFFLASTAASALKESELILDLKLINCNTELCNIVGQLPVVWQCSH